jgi:hypothetical protein
MIRYVRIVVCFIFSKAGFADFKVDDSILKANVVAQDKRNRLLMEEQSRQAFEAANPYFQDVLIFDGSYRSVSQIGDGSYVLPDAGENELLISVVDNVLPKNFKLVAAAKNLLSDTRVSWSGTEELRDVLERAGSLHQLEFVIDWNKSVVAARRGVDDNHVVLFDGAYSPVSEFGQGSYGLAGDSGSVSLLSSFDAMMPRGFRVITADPDLLLDAKVYWSHDENLVSVLERVGLDHTLSFDLDWNDQLITVRKGRTFNPHEVAASQFIKQSFFVPFSNGYSRAPEDNAALMAAAKIILENQLRIKEIIVTGISKTKDKAAFAKTLEKYAKERADVVAQKLVRLGAPEELIRYKTDFEKGFVKPVSGASVALVGFDPKRPTYSSTTHNTPLVECGNLKIIKGSLRYSISASLRQCGFAIGGWGFGDGNNAVDWMIDRPYALHVGGGIDDVLAHFEGVYGIGSDKQGSLVNFFEAGEAR